MAIQRASADHSPRYSVPGTDFADYSTYLQAAIVAWCEDAIISKDLNGTITSWNSAAASMFGYSAEEMIGQSILRLIPTRLQCEEIAILQKIKAGEKINHYETVRTRKDGATIEVSLCISPIRDRSNTVVGASKILRDISLRKRDEEMHARLASIVESSDDAIIGKNVDGIITTWNSAATSMFGYTADEIVGQPILQLIPPELHSEEFGIVQSLRSGKKIDHFRTIRLKKNGEKINVSLTISPIKDSQGQIIGSSKIARDISVELQREELLAYTSTHDELTGLPNRHLFYERLDRLLARAKRDGEQFAVMMLDLDRFKQVNDRYGHQTGDELLHQVALRLTALLRGVDAVARMGGDEFALLIANIHCPGDALVVATKVQLELSKPFVLCSRVTVTVGASIGVCLNPRIPEPGGVLIGIADAAMYKAKAAGGSHIELFTDETTQVSSR